jgi:hypothetical protein
MKRSLIILIVLVRLLSALPAFAATITRSGSAELSSNATFSNTLLSGDAVALSLQGAAVWGANGTTVSLESIGAYNPVIASDGSGGTYLVWAKVLGDGSQLQVLSRVMADGSIAWLTSGGGAPVLTGEVPAIATSLNGASCDGFMGAFRSYDGPADTVRAYKANQDLSVLWATRVCTADGV